MALPFIKSQRVSVLAVIIAITGSTAAFSEDTPPKFGDVWDYDVVNENLNADPALEEIGIPVVQQNTQPGVRRYEDRRAELAEQEEDVSPRSPEHPAFQRTLDEWMPLSPEQTKEYRKRRDKAEEASTSPIYPMPQPDSRSIRLDLEPGEVAPTINMVHGKATVLVFSDATGKAWPVQTATVGNPALFNLAMANEQSENNILVLTAQRPYSVSNMVITLAGHPVPVLLTLNAGRDKLDYRVDVNIGARGPNAQNAIIGSTSLGNTSDSTMLKFLDVTPPTGADRIKTSDETVKAWSFEGDYYIRTQHSVLSPAFVAKATNVSGVNVFKLPLTPVVMISKNGRSVQVKLSGSRS